MVKKVATAILLCLCCTSPMPLWSNRREDKLEVPITVDSDNNPSEREQERQAIELIDEFSEAVARRLNERWKRDELAALKNPEIRKEREEHFAAVFNSIARHHNKTIRIGSHALNQENEEDINLRKGMLKSLEGQLSGDEHSRYEKLNYESEEIDKDSLVKQDPDEKEIIVDGTDEVIDLIENLPKLLRVDRNVDNSNPDSVRDISEILG